MVGTSVGGGSRPRVDFDLVGTWGRYCIVTGYSHPPKFSHKRSCGVEKGVEFDDSAAYLENVVHNHTVERRTYTVYHLKNRTSVIKATYYFVVGLSVQHLGLKQRD